MTTTPTPTGQDTTLRLAYNPAGMQTEIHTPSRAWRTRLAADAAEITEVRVWP